MALSTEEKKALFEEFKRELMGTKKVYVEVCRPGVKLPAYANVGNTAMDIRAALETTILPGETKVIPTGLKMVVPQGYELQVRPRSDLLLNTPLRIDSTPVIIDSEYCGEIGIVVTNTSPSQYYNKHFDSMIDIQEDTFHWNLYPINQKGNKRGIYTIIFGDRIAQIVLTKFEVIEFEQVDDVKKLGLNCDSSLGSRGVK